MNRTDLNRRDFHRLSAAALGGVMAGSLGGCADEGVEEPPPANREAPMGDSSVTPDAPTGAPDADGAASTRPAGEEPAHDVARLMEEPHVCRGLNTCEGKEAAAHGADNACAGQGACATAEHHTCHYENACRGQGGCGEFPGQNACKGQGECAVPLGPGAWEQARAAFENAMQEAGRQVGAAPPPG